MEVHIFSSTQIPDRSQGSCHDVGHDLVDVREGGERHEHVGCSEVVQCQVIQHDYTVRVTRQAQQRQQRVVRLYHHVSALAVLVHSPCKRERINCDVLKGILTCALTLNFVHKDK